MKTIRSFSLLSFLVFGILAALPVSVAQAQTSPTLWQTAINVPANQTYTGSGVVVGIVDNGVYANHALLSANMNTAITSKIYRQSTTYDAGAADAPGMNYAHGTSVAGTVLGNGMANSYGLALDASLVSLDILSNSVTYQDIANALSYANDQITIKNNSWGESWGFNGAWSGALDVIRDAPATTFVFSAGNSRQGTVQINGIDYNVSNSRDANKKAEQSLADTIVVAATGGGYSTRYDQPATFSCYGANVFVTAPGTSITTAQYSSGTRAFHGTSASAPVVSGALAMAVEALPDGIESSARLLKHLLVETSSHAGLQYTPESNSTDKIIKWTTNGEGISFSPTYGFGQLDVTALLAAASATLGVTEQTTLTVQCTTTGISTGETAAVVVVGDSSYYRYNRGDYGTFNVSGMSANSLTGLSVSRISPFDPSLPVAISSYEYVLTDTGMLDISPMALGVATPIYTMDFEMESDMFVVNGTDIKQRLEEVAVTVTASAAFLGDLEIKLTSPSGTESILCFAEQQATDFTSLRGIGYSPNPDGGDIEWTFTSNAFWGEDVLEGDGIWTLEFYDYDWDNDFASDALGSNDISILNSVISTFYMGQVKAQDNDPPPSGSEVPEPAAWVMLVCGAVMLWRVRRYKSRM